MPRGLYDWSDLASLRDDVRAVAGPEPPVQSGHVARVRSMDELLQRDKQREEDGFPRKIRVGRLIKPSKTGKGKVVVVPTTVEEKLYHDPSFHPPEEDESAGGSGEGEEGEVIGEAPVRQAEQGSGAGQGGEESGEHEIESSAYDLGRILTEQFELPNLKDKGKKRSLTRYTYDLTDKHRGFGQLLDKKATLRRILATNMALGRIPDPAHVDPTGFLVAPDDKVYRILSREKDYESQAMIFFVRDYSGSMEGKPTELVVTQHVLIYSWLMYQYGGQVESRFIVHDSDAREVPDFYTYYSSRVAGGTRVAAAYRLVDEMVRKDSLDRDYNIYVFHGTDGDDWDTEGKETLPALREILAYASRVGITIAQHSWGPKGPTDMEKYLRDSGLLEKRAEVLRMDTMQEDADEARVIEGIRRLISEERVRAAG